MRVCLKKVFGSLKVNTSKVIATRCFSSKVPQEPVHFPLEENTFPHSSKIDQETIELLERLSLVDFGNKAGIERLEAAINFADKILAVNTANVKPMVTTLENNTLYLRDDQVRDGNCRTDVMRNAAVAEEEYFVAPQGNIPLSPRPHLLVEEK